MVETCRQAGYHLVDGLERPEAVAIPFIVVVDVRLVLLDQLRDPSCAAGLCDVSKLLSLRATEGQSTESGLKAAFRGTLTSWNKCLCRSAGTGGV